MTLNTFCLILSLLLAFLFQPILCQESIDTSNAQNKNATPSTQSSLTPYEIQAQKKSDIQAQLKGAHTLAVGGATIYGVGLALNIAGTLIFVNDVINYELNAETGTVPQEGLYLSLAGSGISFFGSLLSNSGGSKAHRINEIAYGDAEEFKGWKYFAMGLLFDVGSIVLIYNQVPAATYALSLGAFIFNLSSIVQSVRYSHKAYEGSLAVKDIHVVPMFSSIDSGPIGLKLCAEF